jgi:hypothetical protein
LTVGTGQVRRLEAAGYGVKQQLECALMPRRISEITRRDLWEVLTGVKWWGRLDEIAFLKRLYSLDFLPSTDNRRHDAEGDIIQHRVANHDWADDWMFLRRVRRAIR